MDGDILEGNDGLSAEDSTENEGALQLHRDPACSSRYFVVHDYGVHGVVVPLVDTLNELASKHDCKSHIILLFQSSRQLCVRFCNQ